MQDRLFEDRTFPQNFPLEQFKCPVLLAPHPDDEVFGCAGLLALWAKAGVRARVVILTSGQAQGEAIQRQMESRAAATVLGNYTLDFWELPDREVRCTPELMQRIACYLDACQADLLLAPALSEPHPDHQACALAALWSLAQLPRPVDLCFYESGSTLIHCTHVLDISSVQAQKMQAMQAFDSQEGVQPYASRIEALNHFRAITLGPQVQAAEGLQWLPLAQQGWSALLPALDPLFLHARHQAVVPQDLPLVSVLVRTVGDPRLEQAVASVRAQSYPQIELVVVAAHGQEQAPVWLKSMPHAQWVCLQRKLTRPQAANAALDAARGEYCLFLDDDDLLAPGHIEKLVQIIQATPSVYAAHTDTQVINTQGQEILRYEQPYQPQRLIFTNIFPIHSVLFARVLMTQQHCRFDESLPVLEDWDFWLQVSEHSSFVHAPGLSAIYRYSDRSQLASDAEHAHYQTRWRSQVMHKWLLRLPAQRVSNAAAWYAQQLDEVRQRLNFSEGLQVQIREDLQGAQVRHQNAERAIEQISGQLTDSRDTLAAIYASRGWRLLESLRRIKRAFWWSARGDIS